jgi:hypothetical protein
MGCDMVHTTYSRGLSRWRDHALPLAALALLVLLSYPTWIMPGAYTYDDLDRLNAPQRMLLAWFYAHGHLPLWNPFNFAGQPFLAAGQAGPLYLPNAVFLFLSVVPAFKVSYLFHELLAAGGMYAASYHLWRSRLGAVVSAVAFLTSGFLLGHQIHTQMFDAFAWLPLCFWLCLRVCDRPSWLRIVAMAAALAMEIYAGHPQVTFYVFLMLGLYVAFTLLRNPAKAEWPQVLRVFSAILLALGLGAAQWLPTLDLVSYSSRNGASARFLLFLSFPWKGFLQWLSPYTAGGGFGAPPLSQDSFLATYGSPVFWEYACYVGVVALFLAFAAIGTQLVKSAPVLALSASALVSMALALGSNGFLSDVLVNVPGFNLFRVPARYVGLVDFSLSLLAGAGVAAWQTGTASVRARIRRIVAVSALVTMVALVMVKRLLYLPDWSWSTVAAEELLLAAVVVLQWPRIFSVEGVRLWGTVILAGLDCVSQSVRLSPFVLSAQPAPYVHASGPVAYVQQHLDSAEPFRRAADFGSEALSQDKSAAFQIPSLNGYDSLVPAWYDGDIRLTWNEYVLTSHARSLLDALDVEYVLTPLRWHPSIAEYASGVPWWSHRLTVPAGASGLTVHLSSVMASPLASGPLVSVTLSAGNRRLSKVIDGVADADYYIPLPPDWPKGQAAQLTIRNELWTGAVRVRYVQWSGSDLGAFGRRIPVDRVFSPSPWKKVYSDGQTAVWKNPDELKSAWFTPDLRAPLEQANGDVRLISFAPNRQVWNVTASSHGALVISQMYDPNWHAELDGKAVPLQAVEVAGAAVLTGIPVTPGPHQVVLSYAPASFYGGLGITALSVLLVFIPVALSRRKNAGADKRRPQYRPTVISR